MYVIKISGRCQLTQFNLRLRVKVTMPADGPDSAVEISFGLTWNFVYHIVKAFLWKSSFLIWSIFWYKYVCNISTHMQLLLFYQLHLCVTYVSLRRFPCTARIFLHHCRSFFIIFRYSFRCPSSRLISLPLSPWFGKYDGRKVFHKLLVFIIFYDI